MPSEPGSKGVVTISRRGGDRIRAGHVWVYRSDLLEASGAESGSVVLVQEQTGMPTTGRARRELGPRLTSLRTGSTNTRTLGSAFYSTASEIAIRMISPKPVGDVEQLVRERIQAAIAYRERFVRDTNAYRVIFSEGDFLPGLIVDKYNDVLSLQVLTQAWDSEAMRDIVLSELRDGLKPRTIVERVEPRVRKLEQLPERESGVIWDESAVPTLSAKDALGMGRPQSKRFQDSPGHKAGSSTSQDNSQANHPAALGMTLEERSSIDAASIAPPNECAATGRITTEFQINGVRFVYDALAGQKTGAFLDQRENYAAAERYARGEALDVFCYQGGFALHLARRCDKVTGVDSSRPALEAADQNAGLNGLEIEWVEANAFDLLRDYSDAGKKYDTIVLDPPAFAKSRQNRETAIRGYKELNLRALKMLRPGGILVACSCSYHVSAGDLLEVVASAALDSHRIVRLLENRGQAKDHPSVLGVPETAYLKCLISVIS